MSNIKVSLVIPIYNSEAYLARCLDSLLNQTLKEIEIVCVNDGSTDKSEDILMEYANKYPNVKVFKKENGGCGSARNMGIDNSTGEYVEFVDSDDELKTDAVEKMYNSAKKYNSDLVVCGMQRIDDVTGKLITSDMTKVKKECIIVENEILTDLLFINPGPCNKMHRRSIFKDARFPKIPVVDDLMLTLQYVPNIKVISFVKEPLYRYKVRRESGVNTVAYSTYEQMKDMFIKIKETYLSNNLDKKYIEYIDKMAYIHVGVSMLYRMCFIKDINVNDEISKTIQYLNTSFPTWKNLKTLKKISIFPYSKLFMFKSVLFLYKVGLAKLFIKTYLFLILKLKIDIKW